MIGWTLVDVLVLVVVLACYTKPSTDECDWLDICSATRLSPLHVRPSPLLTAVIGWTLVDVLVLVKAVTSSPLLAAVIGWSLVDVLVLVVVLAR